MSQGLFTLKEYAAICGEANTNQSAGCDKTATSRAQTNTDQLLATATFIYILQLGTKFTGGKITPEQLWG